MTFLLLVEQCLAAGTYGWQPGLFTRWLWRLYCRRPLSALAHYQWCWDL